MKKTSATRKITVIFLALALLVTLSAPALAGGEENRSVLIRYELVSFVATDAATYQSVPFSLEDGFREGVLYGVGGNNGETYLSEIGMPALQSADGFTLLAPDGSTVPLSTYGSYSGAYGVIAGGLTQQGEYKLAAYPIPAGFELAYPQEVTVADTNGSVTFGFNSAVNVVEDKMHIITIPLKPVGAEDPVELYRQYIAWKNGDVTATPGNTETKTETTTLVAKPTSAAVVIDGESVSFDAYNIGGNNYFKLRDLAYALNGSEKQFEVLWDAGTATIYMIKNQPYTAVGGEMSGKGDGEKTPVATTAKIILDINDVSFTAYNIGGNNYFKLRDIGDALDFHIEWDAASATIIIDTGRGYTPGL